MHLCLKTRYLQLFLFPMGQISYGTKEKNSNLIVKWISGEPYALKGACMVREQVVVFLFLFLKRV